MKQVEYLGDNSIARLGHILARERAKRVFLVTGKKSFEICGAKQKIFEILQPYSHSRFLDFSPNPGIKQIERGYKELERYGPDIIVGVGGGSPIDVAKALKKFLFERQNKKIPLVAIPTTAGTGSEATYFIVYYKGKEKQSAGKSDLTLPEYAICDPQFVLNLPREVAASTGLDALSQAVESYWSINSTADSQDYARKAIKLISSSFENAVNTRSRTAKESMMKAANLSGKAINLTLTTACHAIAYPLTSYFGIPHGLATALTLGPMLVYNFGVSDRDCTDKRGSDYVRTAVQEIAGLLDCKDAMDAKEKLTLLMKHIGAETRLSKLGLTRADMEIIIKNGFNPERVKNNPRLLTKKSLNQILESIF